MVTVLKTNAKISFTLLLMCVKGDNDDLPDASAASLPACSVTSVRANLNVQVVCFSTQHMLAPMWITGAVCRVSIKAECVWCSRLAPWWGENKKHLFWCFYFTSSNLFTFRRFKGRLPHSITQHTAPVNRGRTATLYHKHVLEGINWITGGAQVTAAAENDEALPSISTLTGKQFNWFSTASRRTFHCRISSLNEGTFLVFAEQTGPSSRALETCQARMSNLWWWMTSAGSCSVVWALIRKHISDVTRLPCLPLFLVLFWGRINKYRVNAAVSQELAEGTKTSIDTSHAADFFEHWQPSVWIPFTLC